MKKKFSLLALVMLFTFALPIKASALGGYVVIKGEEIYHDMLCDCVKGCYLEDLEWFDTLREVQRAGYHACEECESIQSDFELDGDIHIFSDSNLITSALQTERFRGIIAALEADNSSSEDDYNDGYGYGYDKGYDDAAERYRDEIESLNESHEKEINEIKSRTPWEWVLPTAVICFFIGSYITKNKKEQKS